MKRAVTAGLFLAVGIALFVGVQDILTPYDTWPYHKEETANMTTEIEELRESDIQAFYIGTSHSAFGIDPMRIYEQSGIATYNLASSGQRISASYYVLKEALRSQSPRYVFLDASGLLTEEVDGQFTVGGDRWQSPNATFRNILDSMAFNKNKIEFAKAYSGCFPESQRLSAFLGGLLPIWQYHDRWKGLDKTDFIFSPLDKNYFLKGYYLTTGSKAAWVDVSWMNSIAERNAVIDRQKWVRQIEDGAVNETSDDDGQYVPVIREEKLSWLRRMKELCDEHGAALQLIKVPSLSAPQERTGAWTEIKSELTRRTAADNGIVFLDLQYDIDLDLDWATDTQDLGKHVNYWGAKKVTDFFAGYLQTECGLERQYDELYEADIPVYDTLCKVAELQMTTELSPYLALADSFDDVTVFMSASDDMMRCLSEENRRDLNNFGL